MASPSQEATWRSVWSSTKIRASVENHRLPNRPLARTPPSEATTRSVSPASLASSAATGSIHNGICPDPRFQPEGARVESSRTNPNARGLPPPAWAARSPRTLCAPGFRRVRWRSSSTGVGNDQARPMSAPTSTSGREILEIRPLPPDCPAGDRIRERSGSDPPVDRRMREAYRCFFAENRSASSWDE